MKTAKEMFEALGFVQVELKDRYARLGYYHKNYDETLVFSTDNFQEYYIENLAIDMPILKAIIQQCKELGWLDEYE